MKDRYPATTNLLEDLRLMAAEYRTWADSASGAQAAEYAQLAVSVDKTISELETHARHMRDE